MDRIREIIGERTFGLVDPDTAVIQTLVYPSFADIGQPEPFTDANHNGVHDSGESFNDINGNGHWDPDMGKAAWAGRATSFCTTWSMRRRRSRTCCSRSSAAIVHRAAVAVRNEPY